VKAEPLTKGQVVVAFRREQVLSAAHAVFARKGFRAATVDEIADAAGVAKGTVYLYFTSKDEIYWATLNRGLDDLHARTRAAFDAGRSLRDKVQAFIETRVRFFEDDRQFFVVYLAEFGNVASHRVPARKEFQRRRDELVTMLDQAFLQGAAEGRVRSSTLAGLGDAVMALTHGLVVRRLQTKPARTSPEDVGALMDLLWDGLGSGDA
jgi:AcrR family transcriptional regulator